MFLSESLIADIIYFIILIIITVITCFHYSFQYWQRKKIPYIPPSFPFGNAQHLVRYQEHFGQTIFNLYNTFRAQGCKYGGFYVFSAPALVIIDPDLVKNILIKDFKHFEDRSFFSQRDDEPLSWNLFVITNPTWRHVRRRITPTFTPGKIKMMYSSFMKVSEKLITVLNNKIKHTESVDMKSVLCNFTTDIIALCVFGLETKALEGKSTEFYKFGTMFLKTTLSNNLLMAFGIAYNNLLTKLPLRQVKPEVTNFFVNILKETIEYRERNNVERDDYIDMYIKMKNDENLDKQNDVLTFNEFASQAFAFFIAGFETSAQTMTFCLYELALNKQIQEKLRLEINSYLDKTNGQLYYETIFEMEYLDLVVKETLRKYPINDSLQRKCTESYKVPNSNLIIEKGTPIWISVRGLQNDPEYYPHPEIFDPERFRDRESCDEKKHSFTYIPFGEGPKICVGTRFAMLQIKMGLINLLRNYSFEMDSKTKLPLEYTTCGLLLSTKHAVYLRVTKV